MQEPKILGDMVFFMRRVQPFLEAMVQTVRCGTTDSPRGRIVIHGITVSYAATDRVEPLIPPEARQKFTKILDASAAPLSDGEGKSQWHYAAEGKSQWGCPYEKDNLQWLYTPEPSIPPAEPGSRPLPPLAPAVFDYTTLRQDPENDRRIREYSDKMIVVHSRHMVDSVKLDFAARGWIYSGNHYGDGSVGFQVVLDRDNKVVAPASVLAALRDLQVPHKIHCRRPEPTDEGVEDGWEDHEEGEDGRPPSVEAAEAERQEAAQMAMKAQEEGQDPGPAFTSLEGAPGSPLDATGALRLEEGQKMHIKGVCDHATDAAELRLEIGDNIITVVSTYKQAKDFLVEASVLAAELMTEKGRILATAMDIADRGFGSIEEAAHESKVKEATGEGAESDGGKQGKREAG